MMEKETHQPKKLSPNEMWDQLCVNQLSKVLAPIGYKKVMGGKVEVANRMFLGKTDCFNTFTMSANMIRMYRELVREKIEEKIAVLKEELRKNTENLAASEKALTEAGLLEFSAKEGLKERISVMKVRITGLEPQVLLLEEFLKVIDQIVPAAPKKAIKAKKEIQVVKVDEKSGSAVTPEGKVVTLKKD